MYTNGVVCPNYRNDQFYKEEAMKKYEKLEIEIKDVKVIDIITTSPSDIGQDTPGVGMDDDMLS